MPDFTHKLGADAPPDVPDFMADLAAERAVEVAQILAMTGAVGPASRN